MTSAGRRVRSSQVKRRTTQPAATRRFCFVRSRWKRALVECQARPSTSMANRPSAERTSTSPIRPYRSYTSTLAAHPLSPAARSRPKQHPLGFGPRARGGRAYQPGQLRGAAPAGHQVRPGGQLLHGQPPLLQGPVECPQRCSVLEDEQAVHDRTAVLVTRCRPRAAGHRRGRPRSGCARRAGPPAGAAARVRTVGSRAGPDPDGQPPIPRPGHPLGRPPSRRRGRGRLARVRRCRPGRARGRAATSRSSGAGGSADPRTPRRQPERGRRPRPGRLPGAAGGPRGAREDLGALARTAADSVHSRDPSPRGGRRRAGVGVRGRWARVPWRGPAAAGAPARRGTPGGRPARPRARRPSRRSGAGTPRAPWWPPRPTPPRR